MAMVIWKILVHRVMQIDLTKLVRGKNQVKLGSLESSPFRSSQSASFTIRPLLFTVGNHVSIPAALSEVAVQMVG